MIRRISEVFRRPLRRRTAESELPEEIKKAVTALKESGAHDKAQVLENIYKELAGTEWKYNWREKGLELVRRSIDRAPLENLIIAVDKYHKVKEGKPWQKAGWLLLHLNVDPQVLELLYKEMEAAKSRRKESEGSLELEIGTSYFSHQHMRQGSRAVGLKRVVERIVGLKNPREIERVWKAIEDVLRRKYRQKKRVEELVDRKSELIMERIDRNNMEHVRKGRELERYIDELERQWEQGNGPPPEELFMWKREKKP
ncbi:MAG: hypothetical protein PWP76_683 [Candidatus Diapherotrites archaeon]|nr:hypothetical protein [Candidatus Diapherotrites archaeon]MDN5366990.1 hypothetical protein [Candidatus Diapherotrites archaeon]